MNDLIKYKEQSKCSENTTGFFFFKKNAISAVLLADWKS